MNRKIIAGILMIFVMIQSIHISNVNAKNAEMWTNIRLAECEEYLDMNGNLASLTGDSSKKDTKWIFKVVDKVFFTIENYQNGKILEVTPDGSNVMLAHKKTGADSQQWYAEICEDGYYRIKSKVNDMSLTYDIDKECIVLQETVESMSQKWDIDKDVYDYVNKYITEIEEANPEIVSREDMYKIEALNKERSWLAMEYDKNKDRIDEIDEELKLLGEVIVDDNEVTRKLYGEYAVSPMIADYPTAYGVSWSSTRVNTVYRGQMMELQIMVGKPYQAGSALNSDDAVMSYKPSARGFAAGTKNVIKAVLTDAIEHIPGIGGDLSVGISVYNYAKNFIQGFTPSTVVGNIQTTYTVSQCGEMKLVFTKYQGNLDSTQILTYRGNKTDATITTVSPVYSSNGQSVVHVTNTYNSTFCSKYYNSGLHDYACNQFYNYKNGLSVSEHFVIRKFQISGVDGRPIDVSIPTTSTY